MAKNIKLLYKKHISDTAPDMDKLWDRIEGQLENKTDRDQTQIKVSRRNYRKFAAAAASLVLIIGGISLFADVTKQSSESVDNADDLNISDEKTYEQLSFSRTDTKAYESSYVPKGDEYFTEDSVLEQTDFFADVTVLSARLDSDSATYTLRINRLVSKTGEVSETDMTVESSTPYIMQENREYFIPLREENNTYSIVFENAPQIEISLEGEIVFQNGWKSLVENSATLKGSQKSKNDYFYDRMRYSSEDDLQNLIDKWRSL
ncbi:hypothetical protein [Ruminococcus sp.]|uniref:hypothetical protein n=1 Tax=Ruminococcus sp. TaxID=41978 RepID=UPI0025DE4701|nr:hypothetical protein [uncultured Ruminococcus sp.]